MRKMIEKAKAGAIALHGPLTKGHERAFIILSEEYGEVAKELCTMTRMPRSSWAYELHRRNLISELAQLVGTAELWLQNLIQESDRDEREANNHSARGPVGK